MNREDRVDRAYFYIFGAVVPWGFFVWIWVPLGIIGLIFQISCLGLALWHMYKWARGR
jgi:hypothetical protein